MRVRELLSVHTVNSGNTVEVIAVAIGDFYVSIPVIAMCHNLYFS